VITECRAAVQEAIWRNFAISFRGRNTVFFAVWGRILSAGSETKEN